MNVLASPEDTTLQSLLDTFIDSAWFA